MTDAAVLVAFAFILGWLGGAAVAFVWRAPAADKLWRAEAAVAALEADLRETQKLADAGGKLADAATFALDHPQEVDVHVALHDALGAWNSELEDE